jgi:5-methylthioadenosine/S-adenosylhomocysteine deaminase
MKKIDLPLINCHTHAAMVAFRGLAEDAPLPVWFKKHIDPLQKKMITENFVYKNAKKAIHEMKNNGIVAFADMYFFPEMVARAAKELKMQAVVGVDVSHFINNKGEPLCSKLEGYLKQWESNKWIDMALVIHSIYKATKNYLEILAQLSSRYKIPVHLHVAETRKEVQDCQAKIGVTPIHYLRDLGLLNSRSILAHCVWVSDEDIEIIAKSGASVVHCPLSNLKLGSGIAPISKMIRVGINVSLGTDSAASSNRLDVWEAGKFAVLMQKGLNKDPKALTAKDAFRMMSVNGMRALGLKKVKGIGIKEIEERIEGYNHHELLYSLNINEWLKA